MKIKNFLLGICMLLFVSGCGSKQYENEPSNGIDKEESQVSTDSTSLSNNGIESYLSEANQYYENGDFFNAIETYKKASALENNDERCKEGLCNSYLKWSDSKLSEQDIVASLCLLDQGIGEVEDENYKNSLRSRKKYIIDNTYLAETYTDYDGYYWSREEYDSNGVVNSLCCRYFTLAHCH
ncbi:MAG: hypothetical protein IJ796_03620 [Lachnospiraceae bacterium]|nr:hypothetical protein [Lachnospiraceae bacterium]